MNSNLVISRRAVLGWATAPLVAKLAWSSPALAGAMQPSPLTVLYRRSGPGDAARLDPAAQAATLALENEFSQRGFRVVQPSGRTYEMLDQASTMAVSFEPDAGFSLLFSAYASVRPRSGTNQVVAEVVLQCRAFVGHSIVVSDAKELGAMVAQVEPGTREFVERRSLESAAQRAAALLADKIAGRLAQLSPQDIAQYSQLTLPPEPHFQTLTEAPMSTPAHASSNTPSTPTSTSSADGPNDDSTPRPRARKFALVIGVANYQPVRQRIANPDIHDLPGVAIDRTSLVGALKKRGFLAEHITVLADAQATSASVREHLSRLVAQTSPDDLVLIAISAHGAPGSEVPSGFGMPVLSDFSTNNGGALDFWELQSKVANMPARQTVLLLDTCHSGGATGMMLETVVSTRGVTVNRGLTRPDPQRMAQVHSQTPRAFAVMTSSKANEVSIEDGSGGGLFTQALIRALASAPPDLPLDRLFHDRIEQTVIRESKNRCQRTRECVVQTPQLAYSGRGDAIRL